MKGKSILIVMFTADERKGNEVVAREAGTAEVIYKPLVSEVLSALKRIFSGMPENEDPYV